MRHLLPFLLALLFLPACAPPASVDDVMTETGFDQLAEAVPEEGKADGVEELGPSIAAGAPTEVWAVRNQWADTSTPEARQAGLAWGANSGLDWEQKFERWVGSMTVVPAAPDPYVERSEDDSALGSTVRIRTPHGTRSFDAPTLEGTEFAIFLRVAFASWHGLPFFMTGWDSRGRQAMFAGHFGFVNARGQRIANFPTFRTAYTDHTARWRSGQPWPSDARLRALRLGEDDLIEFLSTPSAIRGAGAYFDEVFLNKRVGYFARMLLTYYGSRNLADGVNMYHAVPASLRAGDVLAHRWQAGAGLSYPIVSRVDSRSGRYDVAVVASGLPRSQPEWLTGSTVRELFVDENAGGEPFARFGGGLRRWRTPVFTGGRWRNTVRANDRANFIVDTDLPRIGGRILQFSQQLQVDEAAEQREAAIVELNRVRLQLEQRPASCAARTRREAAFERLYAVMEEHFGEDRETVDFRFRTLEDRIYGELTYASSRTCCWNSTTPAMHEIIVAYAEDEQRRAWANMTCVDPTVFRAEASDLAAGGDGYGRWRHFAQSIGRGAAWPAWRADERCDGRTTRDDPTTGRGLEADLCASGPFRRTDD